MVQLFLTTRLIFISTKNLLLICLKAGFVIEDVVMMQTFFLIEVTQNHHKQMSIIEEHKIEKEFVWNWEDDARTKRNEREWPKSQISQNMENMRNMPPTTIWDWNWLVVLWMKVLPPIWGGQ